MLGLSAISDRDAPLKLLCLGAHCDDIEIGCGGTLLSLQDRFAISHIRAEVFASTPLRQRETEKAMADLMTNSDLLDLNIHTFKDAFLRESWAEIKERFETIKAEFQPDIIFTHYRGDLHQDHSLISNLTWNTFRNHLILEYEIPKFDGDLGRPNLFVPLTDQQAERKVNTILTAYESQSGKHWFEAETFTALMRLRGLECGGDQRYAEAFYMRKGQL